MNTDLYYEVRGSGPALLLIPGGNGDAGFYAPFAKALDVDDARTLLKSHCNRFRRRSSL